LVRVLVEDVSSGAGSGGLGSADVSIPCGSLRARGTSIDGRLIESSVASARNSVEGSIGWTGGQNSIDSNTLLVLNLEASIADAVETVVVGIEGAGGNCDAAASDVLSSGNAYTCL